MKIALCILAGLAVTSASAQTVFACQWTDINGYTFNNGRWQKSGFKPGKPFFFKLTREGLPDSATLSALTMDVSDCRPALGKLGIICHDPGVGTTLVFDPKTLEGAKSSLLGRLLRGDNRDDLAIELFTCQKM